jgi:hypothetical protein
MARDPIDVLRTGMLYFKSDKKEDSHPRLSVDPVETARVRALINNPPPNEAMMATQRDRYQPADDLYPSTELPPYDPMKANQHALLMEALRRMGALPEGTQPSF